jgi:hypothetical protein
MRCPVLSPEAAVASTSALPEIQPSFVVVVTPAPQLDLLDRRFAAERVRIHVVELHEPALVAPMAIGSDEGAASEIPHCAGL